MLLSTKKATAQTVASNNIIPHVIFRFHEGISICRFHELRHTFAIHWVEHGGNIKNLAAILGHADATITLNRYIHPVLEQMQTKVAAMGGLY